jgi:hypothetical protein
MKKLFSISFAVLILLSGMNLSMATHICGGKVAAVKWSFSGKEATCGMEIPDQSSPLHKGISNSCCRNEISFYSVDNNYNPSSFQSNEVIKSLFQIFDIPVNISFVSSTTENSLLSDFGPPVNQLVNSVSLSKICIFRI